MLIHRFTYQAELGQPFVRLLCSDLHLGSRHSDHNAIVKQFDEALAADAEILINGDLYECIGVHDKRFDQSTLHENLRGSNDLLGASLKLGLEILMPYRKNIRLIGIGNHEESWTKWHGSDPVKLTIEALNREGGNVAAAGFRGYWESTANVEAFKKNKKRNLAVHKLLYLHGAGGESPVTKGLIDFNRIGRNWTFDCLTFGHKHNLVFGADQIGDITPTGKYYERRQLIIQTGSYFRNYSQLDKDSVLNQSYAARFNHAPKPIGGGFLILRPEVNSQTGELDVRQDFALSIVSPWPKKRRAS